MAESTILPFTGTRRAAQRPGRSPEKRWSPRMTAIFVVGTTGLLWLGIFFALWAVL